MAEIVLTWVVDPVTVQQIVRILRGLECEAGLVNPKNETGLFQHANIDISLLGHRVRWAGTSPTLFRIASESPHLTLPV